MNVSKNISIRNRYKQILLNKKLNNNNNISYNTSINEQRNSKSLSNILKNESQAVENNLINKEKTNIFQGIDEGNKEKIKEHQIDSIIPV